MVKCPRAGYILKHQKKSYPSYNMKTNFSNSTASGFSAGFTHSWVKLLFTSHHIWAADYELLQWFNPSLDGALPEIHRAERRCGSQSRPSWLWRREIWSAVQTTCQESLQTHRHTDTERNREKQGDWWFTWDQQKGQQQMSQFSQRK